MDYGDFLKEMENLDEAGVLFQYRAVDYGQRRDDQTGNGSKD